MQKLFNFVGQKNCQTLSAGIECSILDNFVSRLFLDRSTNCVYIAMVNVYNRKWIFILVIYWVCYLFLFIKCRKVIQVSFCDLQSAVVLADIARSSRQKCRPASPILLADFIEQLNHTHKSRPTLSFVPLRDRHAVDRQMPLQRLWSSAYSAI